MNDLNSVYLVGRVVANPKRDMRSGKTSFGLVNRSYRFDREKMEYYYENSHFNIVILKGSSRPKFGKGDRIGINGRVSTLGRKTVIIAQSITMMGENKILEPKIWKPKPVKAIYMEET